MKIQDNKDPLEHMHILTNVNMMKELWQKVIVFCCVENFFNSIIEIAMNSLFI